MSRRFPIQPSSRPRARPCPDLATAANRRDHDLPIVESLDRQQLALGSGLH